MNAKKWSVVAVLHDTISN